MITRRLLPPFFDCTPREQAALMELVGEVKRQLDQQLDPMPDGCNVGFNAGTGAGQTVPHVHVHVIPRYSGGMADHRGGLRRVISEKGNYFACPQATAATECCLSLTTGPNRPLWPRLADRLPGASEIDLRQLFVPPSGPDLVRKSHLRAPAGCAKVRLLVGDSLGITCPDALGHLLGGIDIAGPRLRPGSRRKYVGRIHAKYV